MTLDANEAHRQRDRIDGMTEGEIEYRRLRPYVENLTPAQVDRKKEIAKATLLHTPLFNSTPAINRYIQPLAVCASAGGHS